MEEINQFMTVQKVREVEGEIDPLFSCRKKRAEETKIFLDMLP